MPLVTLCKGRVAKREGRQVVVKATFYDSEEAVLAEADGLWILLTGPTGSRNCEIGHHPAGYHYPFPCARVVHTKY